MSISDLDFARLEAKVDRIGDDLRDHTQSRIRHFGTVLGASGPVLVVILELTRLLRG